MYERMSPQLKQDRERLEQQLADQGLQPGTEAYDRAYDAANRQLTDARLAITAKGGEEQQRLNDMAAQRATFQNAAQRDAFTQAASRSQFYNAAAAQKLAPQHVDLRQDQPAARQVAARAVRAARPAAAGNHRAAIRQPDPAAQFRRRRQLADRQHRHRRDYQRELQPEPGKL